MMLCAARKLIGMARMVENIVAIKPMAMVWSIEPATNVLTLLPGAARPRLTSQLGSRYEFLACREYRSKLSLARIGPATGRPASLSPM